MGARHAQFRRGNTRRPQYAWAGYCNVYQLVGETSRIVGSGHLLRGPQLFCRRGADDAVRPAAGHEFPLPPEPLSQRRIARWERTIYEGDRRLCRWTVAVARATCAQCGGRLLWHHARSYRRIGPAGGTGRRAVPFATEPGTPPSVARRRSSKPVGKRRRSTDCRKRGFVGIFRHPCRKQH